MGPLEGVKVVEVGGIGPGPFCGMMLSDMGANIIRIDRKGHRGRVEAKYDILHRGRRSIGLDLKKPEGVQVGAFSRLARGSPRHALGTGRERPG